MRQEGEAEEKWQPSNAAPSKAASNRGLSFFRPGKKRRVAHISLVFREMWDTTNLNLLR